MASVWREDVKRIVVSTLSATLGGIAMIVLSVQLFKYLDPLGGETKEQAEAINDAASQLNEKLRKNGRQPVQITDKHERIIMADITFPSDLTTSFKDIGGLRSVKDSIYETVILPLMNPALFATIGGGATPLLAAPRGVLFYGPPGTGKTLMAKAIAKDSGATFINVRASTIQNKWFGESQKLIRALFSLAQKLAPSIIFIDEIDLFLRSRTGMDHEPTAAIKAEFMSLWDGLTSDNMPLVTVLGATNRPFDIDDAIQRRMPRSFMFDIPDESERKAILGVMLRGQRLAADVSCEQIAKATQDYSGSDLKELCRFAAMIPLRELIRRAHPHRDDENDNFVINPHPIVDTQQQIRPLCWSDFVEALENVHPTGQVSLEYQRHYRREQLRKIQKANGPRYPEKFGDDQDEGRDARAHYRASSDARPREASPDLPID
jgi:SpoVK/Ycf46/Vps4 family AAA+-type ATPase